MPTQKPDELEKLVRNAIKHIGGKEFIDENGQPALRLTYRFSEKDSYSERIFKSEVLDGSDTLSLAIVRLMDHIAKLDKAKLKKRQAGVRLKPPPGDKIG